MPLDAAGGVAGDGLTESDQFDRLDIERGLLADLPDDGLFQRLTKLDAAARQRIDARPRRTISTLPSRKIAALTAR